MDALRGTPRLISVSTSLRILLMNDSVNSHTSSCSCAFPSLMSLSNITGKDPEIICSSPEYKELKWIAGQFYWVESVQDYNVGGWDYRTELRKFVDGGMTGDGFINGVSGIVNRGCHNVSTDEILPKQS